MDGRVEHLMIGTSIGGERSNETDSPRKAFSLMLAGGLSGVLAKTATAPLGRLTILYQVPESFDSFLISVLCGFLSWIISFTN